MRSVVVTGGSRGLGLAMVDQLLHAGYRVIAVARSDSDGLVTLRDRFGAALVFQAADLADLPALPALARTLRAGGPLYGLVNNAGIGPGGLLATMPDRQIEAVMRLNVVSPITLTKYVTRAMLAASAGTGGRVVNISSIVAGTGYTGLAAYSASKAALHGFTRALSRELGPSGITVNAVAPGFVATEMTHTLSGEDRARLARRSALRRLAEAGDVAAAVVFLLSDSAANITGTVLTVDAGGTA